MATLERQKNISIDQDAIDITEDIPTPFPIHLAQELSQKKTSFENVKSAMDDPQQAESSTSTNLSLKYPRLSVDISRAEVTGMVYLCIF